MRYALAVLVFATLGRATLADQAAPGAAPTQPSPPDGSTVTVTGCLAKGETAGTFVLSRLQWAAPAAPSKDPAAHHDAAAGSGRPATPAANPAGAETLRLAGAPGGVKLDSHVGHTVTATGMLAPLDPLVTPGILLPDAPPRPETRQPPAPRVLNLRSVSHVAATCKG